MRRSIVSRIVGFLILAFLVGIALDWLGLTPLGFWEGLADRAARAGRWLWARADGVLLTVAAGAIVLAPLYAIRWLLGRRR